MNRSGILFIDKPNGITSHDVVARARRALGTRKIGHAGTLDPMATGLLILGVNSSTRLLTYLVGLGKRYSATIRLGVTTDTDDADGQMIARADAAAVERSSIDAAIESLTGELEQVPSTFSAVKVDGRRSYDRARAGEDVVLDPRHVTVSRFDVLDERRVDETIELDVVVECSSGTYIRALARDLGRSVGVGGHLTALRREAIGDFLVEDAVPVDAIDERQLRSPETIAARLFPTAQLDAGQATDLAHGKRVRLMEDDASVLAAITPDGRLAGLVEVADGAARVLVNFPTDEVLA